MHYRNTCSLAAVIFSALFALAYMPAADATAVNQAVRLARASAAREAARIAAERATARAVAAVEQRRAFSIRQTEMRTYHANLQRAKAEQHIAQAARAAQAGVRAQSQSASRSLRDTFAQVNNPGVVYLRYNPVTKGYYQGRAQSTAHYLKRQLAHDAKFRKMQALQGSPVPGFKHDYAVMGIANGAPLRVGEETAIRHYKGIPGTHVENGRYEMNEMAYRQSGGHLPRPASD